AMGHRRKLARLKAALERLRNACVARGVDPAIADQVVTDLVSFANYGFPESHAWSFALIAYATAWLKANYSAEFFLGLLNAWPMGFYPPATLVHDARRHGVTVLGPCMKVGEWDCTTETATAGTAVTATAGTAVTATAGNGNSSSNSNSNCETDPRKIAAMPELGGSRRTPSPSPSPSPSP